MTLRVVIVDDEALARTRLRSLLADCTAPGAVVVGEAANAADAVQIIMHQRVDLVLSDIHMPGADGLKLAQTLRSLPNVLALVFVTAFAEHAVQAFELEAQDYLTKPVRLERLQAALQKAERYLQTNKGLEADLTNDFLVIQERGRTERVPLAEVLYFKAELKYITVRTAAHSYVLEGALNDLESRYGDRFLRIHRNALVARHAVRALQKHHDSEEGDGWAVRLDRLDEPLFVSRRQLSSVRALLASA
ncbi:MAG: response regulator transcription factor [Rhodoferax sp.]|nr:response regulator transcription factor [Rhodoferax sp.]OIP24543.1 MAG: DNA-binding response regulator [Comamonadaceae bacterium CG2_30_60_41]PIW10686.1 MAG: DNA-binding response regulator [Comamonadaceae bacterium CG17_big_fil_post_rev_8_21_14_2_50_60_13]PIY24218.1 MAG: DNA-binding response regulator [Comamonadaceae bacterium CG_4_10_14_3_um_filter_60_75]PJC12033.1 MAG: DNA-binding response regulator [Comamonadaceae bacterium CG_4_9_14_0_8_um_filter_60_18]